MMNIAVIIPAYNAERYITRCLNSCMLQEELNEIIVIDDGSSDRTYDLVAELQLTDTRVRLLHHDGRLHLGRSATRNLGIIEAQSEWIAFCDADDYYLKGRFKTFVSTDPSTIDGTYEAVQSVYERSNLKSSINVLTQLRTHVESSGLQDYLISHSEERISLIGLVVRKSALDRIGLFDTQLTVGEDTDLIWRLVGANQLIDISGDTPLVMRSVHRDNTFQKHNIRYTDQLKFYTKWKALLPALKISTKATARIIDAARFYRYKVAVEEAPSVLKPLISLKYHTQRVLSNWEEISE